MKRITFLAVLILTAGLFFSCTEGMYEGAGGDGNFNLIDRMGGLDGKYIFASADNGSVRVALIPRQKINKGKMSAPLYYTDTGIKYTGSDSFSSTQFTVTVYESESATTPITNGTKNFEVKFYGGSALIEWKETYP